MIQLTRGTIQFVGQQNEETLLRFSDLKVI